MAKVRAGDTKMIGFNAPLEMVETLDNIAIKRWGDTNMTNLLYEAASQYIEKVINPNLIRDQIRQILREEREITKAEIAVQVREQLQIQLRQILGEKYRP